MYKVAILADGKVSEAQAILTALYCYKTLKVESAVDKKPAFSIITSNIGNDDNDETNKSGEVKKRNNVPVTTLTSSQIDLLSSFGIKLKNLIDKCDGYIHYADKITNITENYETNAYNSLSSMGIAMQGVDFHHLLNLQRLSHAQSDKEINTDVDTSLAHYSLNTVCQASQKEILPSHNLRDIRSSLKITLNVQSDLFVELLLPILNSLNITTFPIKNWQLNLIKSTNPKAQREKLGFIESVGENAISADFFIDHRDGSFDSTFTPVDAVQTEVQQKESNSLLEQGLTLCNNQVTQIKRLRTRSFISVSSFNGKVLPTTRDSTNTYEKLWRGNLLDLSSITHFQSFAGTLSISPSEYILDMWLSYFSSAASEIPIANNSSLIEDFANKQFQQVLLNLRTFYLLPLYIHNPELVAECLSSKNNNIEILTLLKQRTRLFLKKGSDYPSDFDLVPKEAWVNMYLSLQQWPQETDLVAYQIDDVQGILNKLKYRFEQALNT